MSSLWRSICSKAVKSKWLTFLASKDAKVDNVMRHNSSSVAKIEKQEKYVAFKPWVSYGFDEEDIRLDRHYMHAFMFGFISVSLVLGGTVLCYLPDPHLKNWAQREAYLQLRYREEHGLPLIDPNLIDPSKVVLPSEEELGYTEIIV